MKKEYRSIARTENSIKSAFITLLNEKKNIQNITVIELCECAGIAKSTFYNHYDDIYEVAQEFENELIEKLSATLSELEKTANPVYEDYFNRIIQFIKDHESIYRCAARSSDIRFFVDKLKSVISKKIFENNPSLPFSSDSKERYVQIRFLTNACVDTTMDYLKGNIEITLDELSTIMIDYLRKIAKDYGDS